MKLQSSADPVSYLFSDINMLRVLRFMLVNDSDGFTAKQLSKKIGVTSKAVLKSLKSLEQSGVVKTSKRKAGKAYWINQDSKAAAPLRELLDFDYLANKRELTKLFRNLGNIASVILSGNITNNHRSEVDVVVVADELNEKKLSQLMQVLSYKSGYELRYIVLRPGEFSYRVEMKDRLVRNIVDFDHEFLVGNPQ